MKFLISLLSIIILLGCSGESTSQDRIAEQSPQKEVVKKESEMLGIFGKDEQVKYVISSPLNGVLVRDGKALANAKIIRRLSWSGNDVGVIDEYLTDDEGYFDIPMHEESLSLGKLTEFVGSITLYIETIDDDNFFYHSSKRSPEIYSDTEAHLEDLVCDMAQEEELVDISRVGIFSRCKWKGMP
ncbi:DUF6795 domain-containing protein [Colwellia psychrerythraea]|uniref:DUF6795 domain-containing protein n=1 Tax=Colwellia psychrerythraea TaxID=28229 RepID=A0A099L231_COLPS|nr:DUF6795 domain-containing protein [Colwellia psychrerythraea]KGJ96921.1 hypothetical protein GAB14E_1389 [Colwellia psychrerythraea]